MKASEFNINLLYLNVCGLKSKLNIPEFNELIQTFSIAIILMGKRELIALLNLSSWCLVMVERLFLTVPRGCLQFVIVVFPDHTHLLFLRYCYMCRNKIG